MKGSVCTPSAADEQIYQNEMQRGGGSAWSVDSCRKWELQCFSLSAHGQFRSWIVKVTFYSEAILPEQRKVRSGCYTPTYASWLNQVETWFNLITQRAIRRGTFKSVKDLIAKIEQFVVNYNRNSRPFVWTATADSTLEKVIRLCHRISETQR